MKKETGVSFRNFLGGQWLEQKYSKSIDRIIKTACKA